MRGDFDFVNNETVMLIIDRAARQVANEYRDAGYEDMRQEAYILVSTSPALQEVVESEEYGLLQFRLRQDLIEVYSKELRRNGRNVSYEGLVDTRDAGEAVSVSHVIIDVISHDYDRALVERLLPMIWDSAFAWGLPVDDTIPDPDMPRKTSNKAEGNNLSAYLADIRYGWNLTPLTLKERKAMFLYFALDELQSDIAAQMGVSQQTISDRITSGVGKIAAFLNGGYYYDPTAD